MFTPSQARELLARYAADATRRDPARWAENVRELERLDGRQWLFLDGSARSFHYASGSPAPVSGTRDWLSPSLNEPSGFVAAITSMHADGRIRQRATQALGQLTGPLVASALAVRAFDHVPEVRAAALRGLAARTGLPEVSAVLCVLTAGRDRQHASVAFAVYVDALLGAHEADALLGALRADPDRGVQRWAVQTSHTMELLSVDELVTIVAEHPDQLVRAWASAWLETSATPIQLRRLLAARRIDGRLLALTRLPDEHLSTDKLLPMLADRSARVRETARWRARKRGVELVAFYRDALKQAGANPSWLVGCLEGLSAEGTASDADLALGFIQHPSPTVRAEAVTTAAKLLPSSTRPSRLLPQLLDVSPRVAAAAAQACARAGVSAAQAETAWTSTQPWSRRAAWRLTRAAGSWARVTADVRAAQDDDELLAGLGRAGLRNWLQTTAATTWRQPSQQERSQIIEGLSRTGLTWQEQRVIAFHAGLPTPDQPEPPPAPEQREVGEPAGVLVDGAKRFPAWRLRRRPRR